MTTEIELAITIVIMLAEIGAIAYCYYKAKQPPDPLKLRFINYTLVIIVLALLFIATLAHVITLVTGSQVKPRRRRGM
jgi:hypothetical protein